MKSEHLVRLCVFVVALGAFGVLVSGVRGDDRRTAFRKMARFGDVSAEATWAEPYGEVRVRITRRERILGRRVLRGVVPTAIEVKDLDSDREPEVILTVTIGGVHNRAFALFFTFDSAATRYRVLKHWWHEFQPQVADVNRDGATEFVTVDHRFSYAFTSFAYSYFPVQVWTYRRGALSDTTRGYRTLIREDAAQLWRWYLIDRRRPVSDVRGVLAAYQADKYLLGEQADGWKRLHAALRRGELGPRVGLGGWPMGRRYLRALRHFLQANGYAAQGS